LMLATCRFGVQKGTTLFDAELSQRERE